jgi:ppGpp synthetase/RelA/SpoT-type nucleotidyltranferase
MLFSNNQINKAGKILAEADIGSEEYKSALETVNAWRSEHRYALEQFRELLMEKARAIDINFIFASRLKKIESIKDKLRREENMQLSKMQDIGGCRLIFARIEDVYEMVNELLSLESKHILKRKTDYIDSPRSSGYRCYHLIFEYHNGGTVAENVKIEIQVRTYLEHIWATSVESASIIAKAPLKSSKGSKYWLDFFRLVSSYFAIQERKPLVQGTPATKKEITEAIRDINREHGIIKQLEALNSLIRYTEFREKMLRNDLHVDPYYLLCINEKENSSATGYSDFDQAYKAYTQAEEKIGENAVLVSTNSAETLRQAYPNYFIDINQFLSIIQNLLF